MNGFVSGLKYSNQLDILQSKIAKNEMGDNSGSQVRNVISRLFTNGFRSGLMHSNQLNVARRKWVGVGNDSARRPTAVEEVCGVQRHCTQFAVFVVLWTMASAGPYLHMWEPFISVGDFHGHSRRTGCVVTTERRLRTL